MKKLLITLQLFLYSVVGWAGCDVQANSYPINTTHHSFISPSMGIDVGYNIYLPPTYNTVDSFPVIYFLHGKNGNEARSLWLVWKLHNAIKSGQVEPIILVISNGCGNTFWSDAWDESVLTETMFIDELIPLIDAQYSTINHRSGRYLEGFSMGGFGALKMLFKFPELFSSAVTYGAALHTEKTFAASNSDASIWSVVFNNNPANFAPNSPTDLALRYAINPVYPVKVKMIAGSDDGTLELNRAFRDVLNTLNLSAFDYREADGFQHLPQPYYDAFGVAGFNFH